MIDVRDATEKCIWPGHYMVEEGIKAFPKSEFYLYHPIVNRAELETGHRDKANHVKGKKKTEIFNGVCFKG